MEFDNCDPDFLGNYLQYLTDFIFWSTITDSNQNQFRNYSPHIKG